MTLADVNLLIHAVNRDSPDHVRALTWWNGLAAAGEPVLLPWMTLVAFARLSTNPKVMASPLTIEEALEELHLFLGQPHVVVVHPTSGHAGQFDAMCRGANARHNLVTDAHLAALALEHDAELASCDTDFARFPGLKWVNPLAA